MIAEIDLDEKLLADAQEYTQIDNRSALVHEALKALIHREASRRLARLGGTQPHLFYIPRDRTSE